MYILPLYNKASYVEKALRSVINQSYNDWELVVVDDGSTDGGENVVKPFLGDLRHFLSQNNVGVAVARNRGVEATKNAFPAFLDNKKSRLTDNVIFHEVVNLLVQIKRRLFS